MEFDEIMVKESPGLCRCCLSEGCYKDMGTEYAWMNENEVYADMLLECFDISISQVNDGPNGPNRLICEVCITRLRDACYFKKQVLESEKKFIDMVGRGEFKSKAIMVYSTSMKVETAEEEDAASLGTDDADPEYLDDEIEYLEEDILKAESQEPGVSEVTADPLPVRGKRGRPRKAPVKADKKKVKTEPKPKSSKPVLKDQKPTKVERQAERIRRINVWKLLKMIIKYSTLKPFRWHKGKYMCFYCDGHFSESSDFKEHLNDHPEVNLNEIYLKTVSRNARIKLDITQICCTPCQQDFDSFKKYLVHLSNEHSVLVNEEIAAQFEVFKLDDELLHCLECDESFYHFVYLLKHTHKKHDATRKYLCELCGQGFWLKNSILIHIKQAHDKQRCKYCDESFPSIYALSNHVGYVHETYKLKCSFCEMIFPNRYLKKRHLAFEHDLKSEQFICDICNKIFTRRFKLMEHKRRMHPSV